MIDIDEKNLQTIYEIIRRHIPHVRVGVFGSRAQGTSRKFSDIDLIAMTLQPLPLSTMTALKEEFSESDLPFRVDIIDQAATDEEFRRYIDSQIIEIYRPS